MAKIDCKIVNRKIVKSYMKKIYIQPSMKVFAVKANAILAGSIQNAPLNDTKGSGVQLGKELFGDDWDDDQE